MVDVPDLGEVGIGQQRRLIDRALGALGLVRAHLLEARREAREALQRGARARELLAVESQRAVVVTDRHECVVEAAVLDRGLAAGLAVDAEPVALLAREALAGRD